MSETKPCPKCGKPMERDEVDVGIGSIPSGPWGCFACGYVEPDPYAALSGGDPLATSEAEADRVFTAKMMEARAEKERK